MTITVIAFFHAVITVRNKPLFQQAEKLPNNSIPQSNLPTINERKPYISTETNQSYQSISQEGKDHEQKAGTADFRLSVVPAT